MRTVTWFPTIPNGILFLVSLLAIMVAGIILYTLWRKGNVSIEVSHGSTIFKIEAQELGADARKSDCHRRMAKAAAESRTAQSANPTSELDSV